MTATKTEIVLKTMTAHSAQKRVTAYKDRTTQLRAGTVLRKITNFVTSSISYTLMYSKYNSVGDP